MNKEYVAALVVLLCFASIQIIITWLIDAGLGLLLLLTGLTALMLLSLVFLARTARIRYQKLTATLRECQQLFRVVNELTRQNHSLAKDISELSRARESLTRQQTKIFDLLQEKNK